MRFTAFLLPIVLGAVSAGPCRPSSAESSTETTELGSMTTTDLFQTITTTLSTDDATTVVPTTEIESASTTTHMIESTTESAGATSSTTAASRQCIAPASLQCCLSVGKANDAPVSLLLGLLGIVIKDLSTPIGMTCSSTPNAGACVANRTPVCCSDTSHGGLIAIGCTPV
ncbi:hypothetical protein HYE67_002271 [Fusarium culmorum]|uniref:Hydrophobin n=1 Tax=Fusarium culmorum TaxID=5516 RepID=A0A2T4GX63_FUSCU|nr:hypothetical protein FCULG_00006485 [Fusarium culmorum]QPC60040.1 hypothetical protein HYE67_002271 [Fusarium culmorum]